MAAQQRHHQLEKEINLYSEVEAIVSQASKRSREIDNSQLSKTEKTELIKAKRKIEILGQNQSIHSSNLENQNKVISLDNLVNTNPQRAGVQKYLNRRKEMKDE